MADAPAGGEALVSILTPSLNQGCYIGDCIDSVSTQTHRPIEHVICDGGSTDETLDLLRRAPDHVRWVSEPDVGQANALNKAFALSRGSVIGWINSDDAYADRRAVEWAILALTREPGVDGVIGHALLVDERNRVLQFMWCPPLSLRLLRLAHYVVQPTLFVRRTVVGRQPYFLDERLDYVFDRDLLLRLAATGTLRRVPHVLAVDRHQSERKVESQGYRIEAERFNRSFGLQPSRRLRLLGKALTVSLRLVGAFRIATERRRIQPPIALSWPSVVERIRLQLLTPRRRMPFR